jgi:protein HOOK3
MVLESKYKNIKTDYEQQKSHLVEALLAKDKLRQELAGMKEGRNSVGENDAPAAGAHTTDEQTNTELQTLKEVSNEAVPLNAQLSFESPALLHLPSHLCLDPYTSKSEQLDNIAQIDEAALLILEREAIGALQNSKTDDTQIAVHISLPMSPSKPSPVRKQIFRARKWTNDEWVNSTTVTDDTRSKPRNKKGSSKTYSNGSKWPRKAV